MNEAQEGDLEIITDATLYATINGVSIASMAYLHYHLADYRDYNCPGSCGATAKMQILFGALTGWLWGMSISGAIIVDDIHFFLKSSLSNLLPSSLFMVGYFADKTLFYLHNDYPPESGYDSPVGYILSTLGLVGAIAIDVVLFEEAADS